MKPELIYEGSVKNVYKLGDDNLFEFSDRYSIFDWGEMPDKLEKKGEALALMGALFFEVMEKNHVPHHFLGLTKEHWMKVKNVPVVRPTLSSDGTYDYSYYQTCPQSGLVPLEIMFRFGVGTGSSLLKRVTKEPSLLKQWGLDSVAEGDRFEEPLIDFSTKLEKGDRYLTHEEARQIAGLGHNEFQSLMDTNKKVARILLGLFRDIGLELWDGKTEWTFTAGQDRGFMLVDTIGLDELRLEVNGQALSKEFLRQHYKHSPWYGELEEAKKHGPDFKARVKAPEHLPAAVKFRAESLYLSFTNELSQLVKGVRPFGEQHSLQNWLGLES